jgi:hypothetical protein
MGDGACQGFRGKAWGRSRGVPVRRCVAAIRRWSGSGRRTRTRPNCSPAIGRSGSGRHGSRRPGPGTAWSDDNAERTTLQQRRRRVDGRISRQVGASGRGGTARAELSALCAVKSERRGSEPDAIRVLGSRRGPNLAPCVWRDPSSPGPPLRPACAGRAPSVRIARILAGDGRSGGGRFDLRRTRHQTGDLTVAEPCHRMGRPGHGADRRSDSARLRPGGNFEPRRSTGTGADDRPARRRRGSGEGRSSNRLLCARLCQSASVQPGATGSQDRRIAPRVPLSDRMAAA